MHKERGEFTLAAAGNPVENMVSADVQGSVALHNHIAIMGSYFTARSGPRYVNNGRSSYYDFAGGYFGRVDACFYEAYAGLGTSRQYHEYGSCTAELPFTKFFIQQNIGFTEGYIDVILSHRACMLQFGEMTQRFAGTGAVISCDPIIDQLNNNSTIWLFEPAITFRIGGRWLKFQVQANFAVGSTQDGIDPGNFSFGVQARLKPKRLFGY
jgi:hypothetical protein